ncbi:MAG: flagellar assembly protein FliW [Alphaproteobacteria bacterium]
MTTHAQSAAAGARAKPKTAAPPGEELVIETRFGAITFKSDDMLDFPNGLIGLPAYHRFGLAPIPDPRMAQFHLLQSLEEKDLSFLVLPIAPGETTIARADADDACAASAVPAGDARFFLIVTLRKGDDGLIVSVNLRAPLIVDAKAHIARQCVLSNPDYPIRKVL